ncbi:hypothetical protein [Amycolatopsis thailandensis]|uniref:hypothetical protein n=1 Tax=Amycolatopsis thailandensis TaxID=589330 RepID=UPI00362769CF
MLAWNEADHPRDAQGRFTTTGAGASGAVFLVVVLLILGGFLKLSESSDSGGPPATWKAGDLEFKTREFDSSDTCDAYGEMKAYLATFPCSGVKRGLFDTGSLGSGMIVATATVTMPSADQAERLRELADRPGTGNITELTTGFDGRHYASRVVGTIVTITQAKAQFFGDPSSKALRQAAQAALDVPLT